MAATNIMATVHLKGYTGAEAFLVGISPSFWAHVPLFISQIHDLVLLDEGINCLLIYNPKHQLKEQRGSKDVHGSFATNASPQPPPRVIPISKCKIVGTVVYAERKANGCVTYVLDDGTGLIDCLHWDTEHDDYDGLPPLLPNHSESGGIHPPGTVLQVFGRIQCVAVGDGWTEIELAVVRGSGDTDESSRRYRHCTSVVREVHASVLMPLTTHSACRAMPWSLNGETRHWKDCLDTQQRQLEQRPLSDQEDMPHSNSKLSGRLLNPLDMISFLGSDIAEQVADRTNLPSAHDESSGLWRLFGAQCRCDNTTLRHELLYCHCIATPEMLDDKFVYRDRLLESLVQAEQSTMQSTGTASLSTEERSSNDANDGIENGDEDHARHFLFQYEAIVQNVELNAIAAEQAQRSNQSKTSNAAAAAATQTRQLVRNTFRALCKDGILYLVYPERDVYILLSRTGVLEPYVTKSLACDTAAKRAHFFANRPRYLQAVPRARMQVIRRALTSTYSSPMDMEAGT